MPCFTTERRLEVTSQKRFGEHTEHPPLPYHHSPTVQYSSARTLVSAPQQPENTPELGKTGRHCAPQFAEPEFGPEPGLTCNMLQIRKIFVKKVLPEQIIPCPRKCSVSINKLVFYLFIYFPAKRD